MVEARISDELQQGQIVCPIGPTSAVGVHTSPLGLVPKPCSDKLRMIVDLSSPVGFSVNDGIAEDLCSLQYSSGDNAVQFITSLGQGTQLVKLDLNDAYRILPIHPQDHPPLGIRWQDQIYIDRSLPFGLRSAHKIFSAFADMVAWCIHCQGVRFLMHYLDDFLILGAPGTQEAAVALDTVQYFLTTAGILVAHNKTEGPTTALSFLGILIDSVCFELRLPADKLVNLVVLVSQWRR